MSTMTIETGDADAVRKVVLKVFANWTAMNPDANDDLYRGHDHMVLFDIEPMQDIGWNQQKRRLRPVFAGFERFHITPNDDLEVHCLGNSAWTTCTWMADIVLKTGEATHLEGRATLVLEKHDGRWLVVHDHLSVPAPQPERRSEHHDREAIRAHIEGVFRAFIRKDREAIRRGHTTDWQGFQLQSSGIVRGIDEYMKVTDASIDAIRDTRYQIHDLDIQLHGDIAVVFYVATVWGLGQDNREQPLALRAVDIYRREGGGWNQAGSNICRVPE